MKRETVRLPDGFNGETVLVFVDPLETDGDLLKLQVAEPGRGHLFRWASKQDVRNAIGSPIRLSGQHGIHSQKRGTDLPLRRN